MIIGVPIIEASPFGNDRSYHHTGRVSRANLMGLVSKLTPAEWVWVQKNLYTIVAAAILQHRASGLAKLDMDLDNHLGPCYSAHTTATE